MPTQDVVSYPYGQPLVVPNQGPIVPYLNVAAQGMRAVTPYVGAAARRFFKGKRAKRRKRNPKPKGSGVVMRDGTTSGSFTIPKKKKSKRKSGKRKKSVKTQLKEVRRLIPKKSYLTTRLFEPICMATNSVNTRKIFNVRVWNKTDYAGWVSSLAAQDTANRSDYTSTNSNIQMSQYFKLCLKNAKTSNVKFSYAFYVCKDDDNENPVQEIREELVDRGYLNAGTIVGEAAATATQSLLPGHLNFTSPDDLHAPCFVGGALARNWKKIGKVKSATISPGSSAEIKYSRKITYVKEAFDQDASFNHLRKYDVYLVIDCMGEIAHDNTNKLKVGYASWQLDCVRQQQVLVTYANARGLREVNYSDNIENTGFTTPVVADNFASEITQAIN